MQQLRSIIVDDEPLPLELLADYVNKTPFLQLAGTYTNPLIALTDAHRLNIDLIFLDIQMPEINGVQFLQLLNKNTKVIFTTAYPNYALQGYELDVIDYLLKPISFERFLKAVTKALHDIQPTTKNEIEKHPFAEQALFVKANNKIMKVFLSDILYIEGLKEYITIHTALSKIVTLQNMKKMEGVLPHRNFLRVHKSFIVAIDKIDSIERNRIYIRKDIIPIGETYKKQFFTAINKQNLL